jgi:hypothetical protein
MMVKTALALAARAGFAVFPCRPRSKLPATEHGCKDASKDPATIKAWWSKDPDYNIAIACGEISGLFVVDIDGLEGEASLAKFESEYASLPATVEAVTGKGRHLYFRWPQTSIRNSVKTVAEGVDVRGSGGYVIAPPSLHPGGKRYAWSVDSAGALAEAPQWLLEKVCESSKGNGKARPPSEWRTLVSDGVAEGARDDTIAKLSGHLLRRFTDPFVVLELMQCWNISRCRPPLPAGDVERIVSSICRKELQRRSHA